MKDISIVLVTVDRSPQKNYLIETLERLHQSGVFDSPRLHTFYVVDSGKGRNHLPTRKYGAYLARPADGMTPRTANENVAEALQLGSAQPSPWVLFLEDDIAVCKNFLDGVGEWLDRHAVPECGVYSFGCSYPQVSAAMQAGAEYWEYPVEKFYCTQAIAFRRETADEFGRFLAAHPIVVGMDGIDSTAGYDLALVTWALQHKGWRYFRASAPSFVQHIGTSSVISENAIIRTFDSWQGSDWVYQSRFEKSGVKREKTVLFIGDAGCPSGFARNTHKLCDALHAAGWKVHILGLNFNGDSEEAKKYPYTLWSAMFGGDWSGQPRIPELLAKIRPDLVVIQQDPWNFPAYLSRIRGVPVIGIVAVDGLNCQGDKLNGLRLAVFWTEFGRREAIEGGYAGNSNVLPLGVDRAIYRPIDRQLARKSLGLSGKLLDAFIVGNINRNGPRKRFDLSIEYFAEWVTTRKITDAILYLQQAPTDDPGFDCPQLVRYFSRKYGIDLDSMFLRSIPPFWIGWPEDRLAHIYSMLDVGWSASQGEGFGLTTLEGMACGVPQIVSDWAAYGEWARDGAWLIPCTSTMTTPGMINSIGGIADREETLRALDTFYNDKMCREEYGQKALTLSKSLKFDWTQIGNQFVQMVEDVYLHPRASTTMPFQLPKTASLEVPTYA